MICLAYCYGFLQNELILSYHLVIIKPNKFDSIDLIAHVILTLGSPLPMLVQYTGCKKIMAILFIYFIFLNNSKETLDRT